MRALSFSYGDLNYLNFKDTIVSSLVLTELRAMCSAFNTETKKMNTERFYLGTVYQCFRKFDPYFFSCKYI